MNIEEIKDFDFKFNPLGIFGERNAEIALRIAKKETLKSVSLAYGLSTTTCSNAFIKVCRVISRKLVREYSELFSQEIIDKLFQYEFKNDLGIALISNFMLSQKNIPPKPFASYMSEVEEKERNITQEKIDLILNRIDKKRNKFISDVNAHFDLLEKWCNELKGID